MLYFLPQLSSHPDGRSSPHSDSKSLCSLSASDDEGDNPEPRQQQSTVTITQKPDNNKSNSDQPLDLSNKGSSPSVSPLSREDRSLTPGHNASPMIHWSQFTSLGRQMENGSQLPLPIDLYRFNEENEGTSSSNEEDGNYVCDKENCDKTFTKRSSLARHKYEHSGI